MLIVSHDRAFIDKICDCIIEIKNQQIEEFNGDYSKYIENEGNKNWKHLIIKIKMKLYP